MQIVFDSGSPEFTREIGLALGKILLNAPAVILMKGDLGSGKTTISKAIVEGLGIRELVTSPTYTLMNVYGGGKVYHFDLYRLQDEDELREIGFEEILEEEVPVLIEWPEIILDYPFEHAIYLEILYGENETQRILKMQTGDPLLMKGLENLGA